MIEPGSNGSERLLTLRLNTTAGPVTLVSVYAPTMSATSDTKDEFYENLAAIISSVPNNEQLILLGDFNARVGADHDTWPSCIGQFLLTYLSPWLLLEHRPCTTSLQRLLSWAILSSCFQLSPVCVMSASRSRRQVFFGLPLFRLPWGFHVKACLVTLVFGFLNVWPSHPHLLLRISISI